jgi:spore coat polysaccharide biosynthesis protein SpsF
MGKTVACLIARTVSTRLPLKVLRLVDDHHSMLDFIIERVKMAKKVDQIYLCTSDEPTDDILEDVTQRNGIHIFRGSAEVPIDRMMKVGELTGADNLIRITGDDVFNAWEYLDEQISFLEDNHLDYVRTIGIPLGSSAEVMSFEGLRKCYHEMDISVSEYLTLFIFNPEKYKCGIIKPFKNDYTNISLTVDTRADLTRTRQILSNYLPKNKIPISTKEIVEIIENKGIENSYFLGGGTVKLPYGKVISYENFLHDMKNREKASLHKYLF